MYARYYITPQSEGEQSDWKKAKKITEDQAVSVFRSDNVVDRTEEDLQGNNPVHVVKQGVHRLAVQGRIVSYMNHVKFVVRG